MPHIDLTYTRKVTRNFLQPYLTKSRYMNLELGESIILNGVVLPGSTSKFAFGGIIDVNKSWVKAGSWHEEKGGSYNYDESKAARCNESVIYAGFLHWQWGHNITDNLKKLWYFHTERGKKLMNEGVKIIYVTIENKELPESVKKTFMCAGIDISKMERVTTPTSFKKIIIPDNSIVATERGRIYTKEYVDIVSRIKKSVSLLFEGRDVKLYDKIYFTRTLLPNNNRDYGEKNIENSFRHTGYKVLAPEKLDTLEQIYLLMNCKKFAATEGSISHNALFCKQGTEVAILLKATYHNGYQPVINEVANINAIYIDAHHTPIKKNPWHGPFFLCLTPELKSYLNLSPLTFPYQLSWSYLKFIYRTQILPLIYKSYGRIHFLLEKKYNKYL